MRLLTFLVDGKDLEIRYIVDGAPQVIKAPHLFPYSDLATFSRQVTKAIKGVKAEIGSIHKKNYPSRLIREDDGSYRWDSVEAID